MNYTTFVRNTLAVAALLVGSQAPAAVEIPKEGRFDFNYCMGGKAAYSEVRAGLATGEFDLVASTYTNGPGKAFDRQGSRCVGVYEIVDGKYRDYGVCTQVDADGDKWIMRTETGADMGGKWVAVGGSGKYEGMTATGSYAPVGAIPPAAAPGVFNRCNRNTGTYKLR